MEITRSGTAKAPIVDVRGKLDAYWSDALSRELDSCIRGGASRIALDLHGVDFISSAGLRVLLVYLKQLRAINGTLRVVNPSRQVLSILDLSGLTNLLLIEDEESAEQGEQAEWRALPGDLGSWQCHPLKITTNARTRYYPTPSLITGASSYYHHALYPKEVIGFGIGAFGELMSGCEDRFGEYLSVAGVTVTLPTDGRNHPDYMIEDGVFIPEITVLSGVSVQPAFHRLLRFQAAEDSRGIPLSELVSLCLRENGGEGAAIVMIAESAGLIGSAIKQSPPRISKLFSFPEVRDQFSFTIDPVYEDASVLVTGVFSAREIPDLSGYMRPLGKEDLPVGHLHAAAFSYRPLASGRIDLEKNVRDLFDEEEILGMLHLLRDDRVSPGMAESEFVRGACWVSPLGVMQKEYLGKPAIRRS